MCQAALDDSQEELAAAQRQLRQHDQLLHDSCARRDACRRDMNQVSQARPQGSRGQWLCVRACLQAFLHAGRRAGDGCLFLSGCWCATFCGRVGAFCTFADNHLRVADVGERGAGWAQSCTSGTESKFEARDSAGCRGAGVWRRVGGHEVAPGGSRRRRRRQGRWG